jgi:iron complex outermembrane receptor protein
VIAKSNNSIRQVSFIVKTTLYYKSHAIKKTLQSAAATTSSLSLTIFLAAFILVGAFPLQAQENEETDKSRHIEEIVVTAQKRAESLQDVPISMTVLGGDELSELSIFDFTETAALTPGVEFFPGVQAAAIRLRGVGPAFFALTSPQSVAVFIDDFAQSSVGVAFATLVDIERIELLRGPQGTLYGQNAPGGAYNINTKAPNATDVEGYIAASYGQQNSTSLESVDIRGAVNVPLVKDVLGLRLAGVYADSDGYLEVKNPVSGEDSTGGKEHQSFRSRLLWLINDDMDFSWTVNYSDLTDQPVDFNIAGYVPGTGGDNPTPAIRNKFEHRNYYGDFLSNAETDIADTNFHLRWTPDAVNIDLQGSYQKFDSYQLENREPYPERTSQFEITLNWETTTAELRFSDTGDKLDYLAGIYYANREIDGFFNVTLAGVNLLGPAIGAGDVKAAYTNLTFHLSDKWDFSAGVRYDRNDIWTESDFVFLSFNSVVDDEATYDHLSWSLKLRHYFDENTTGYIAIDNAYKQGGFNNLVPGLQALAPFVPEIAAVGAEMLAFEEETSTAFEIGLKGSALDARLSYNLAIFYQQFEDHQLTQPADVTALKTPLGDLNTLFANQLTNAEEVITKGVEVDLVYLLAQHWDVTFRGTYFDATIEEWSSRFCPPGEEDSPDQVRCPAGNGDALNILPQFNTNFQLGHHRSLSANWDFSGRFTWTWRAPPNVTGNTTEFANSKNILGLTLGLAATDSGLSFQLWGKNLTDEDLNLDPGFRIDGDPSLPQPSTGRYYPGREYGVSLNYTF